LIHTLNGEWGYQDDNPRLIRR